MKKIISALLVVVTVTMLMLSLTSCNDREVGCDEVVAAYRDAGYYVSHYHHSEIESDGEICYLDIKMFAEPTGNTIADNNFIYIHFFDTEEGAKRFKEEYTYNIGVWFFALPFGEFRWLKSRQFGKIGCSYFNSEMVRPLRRLV